MSAKWMAVLMAVSFLFLGAFASGALACAQKMVMAQGESEELGPASSSPQYDTEEMSPATPAPEQGTEEMSPSSSEPQSGSEEMTPAGSAGSHQEEYVTPKNAPYQAPAESQPY